MEKTKILIVEDELLIAENLAIKLEKQYQVVDIVSSGKAALQKAQLYQPDLILMDIAIKGELDGIQTAELIKEKQNVAIVFLTAYADDKTLERAILMGCYGYILKPFKERELHVTIKIALKKHREQNSIQTSLQEVTELLGEYSAEKTHIYEDDLTKLPNQLMLRELFSYLLTFVNNSSNPEQLNPEKHHNPTSKKLLAVIYIKPYKFERIITSLGNTSDLLIIAIAERLTKITSSIKQKCTTVKLQQYSDFSILLSGLSQRHIASNFAQSLLEEFKQPLIVNNKKIFVAISIGISFYPFDNLGIEKLLEQAKQAMLYAESQGSNKYQLYTSAFRIMNTNTVSDLSLEADLHQAIDHNQLELYYQPKIDLKTGKISSSEALLRWNHPNIGIVAPNKIFPLAEAIGLNDKIENWVLTEACKKIKQWHQKGFEDINIAINLSGYQFKQSNLFHNLTKVLFESDLEPEFLELELTEEIIVENVKNNIQKLNLIKNLGIGIALDDFGTGYSSLSYLHQFPFDTLKIDRCFINNINCNHKNAVIVKSIITMAHQLNIKVVAEGIETQAELDFLIDNQCDEIQGYFLSRPVPAKDFERLLSTKQMFDSLIFKNNLSTKEFIK